MIRRRAGSAKDETGIVFVKQRAYLKKYGYTVPSWDRDPYRARVSRLPKAYTAAASETRLPERPLIL